MAGWRERWRAIVASDVSGRDGIGWEFTALDGGSGAWAVFREDGGPFPVFSSSRGPGDLPTAEDTRAMTEEAVADLLAAMERTDAVGWTTRNISTALALAAMEILFWEGEEWALESDAGDRAVHWAGPAGPRVPYHWLRARTDRSDQMLVTYQDDALFGLNFISGVTRGLPGNDVGSLRSRRDVPLLQGRVNQVEVVYDTLADGALNPGVVTEVLLHGDGRSTLLIAGEAYSRDEWHLYDESVVALPDLAAADRLRWVPGRRPWQSTEGPLP